MEKNLIDTLQERGFIDAMTSHALRERAANTQEPLKVYCGFDPSASSLHLGNMVGIMGLAWFQRFGHIPIALVGGATGMIGDPSGKSSERNLLDEITLRRNQEGVKKNIESILLRDLAVPPLFLNNYDWFKNFSFIAFLREIGKYFRVNTMLAKESVKARFESEEGISFTEFSYQILQAYDFYHLFTNFGVTVQIGGSDQWGNITAGIDLVRKLTGKSVYGLTFSLLTKSDGQKFGKSEKGAIWLSQELLSPFELYQHLFRVEDADVIRLLKMLTFLDIEEIRGIEYRMQQDEYLPNTAQKILAEEVCRLVHGSIGLEQALVTTRAALPGKLTPLQANDLEKLYDELPHATFARDEIIGAKLIDIVTAAHFLESKGEARRLIRNGGLSINTRKIEDENALIESADLIEERFIVFAFGKKHKAIVKINCKAEK